VDAKQGILNSYAKGRAARDPLHQARDYFGDQSGFGYNWGYLGSNTNLSLDYRFYPDCQYPARGSELSDPTGTVAFASSIYYSAPWNPRGDGLRYDFGLIDPPKYWNGNPNVDFRHGGTNYPDIENRRVVPKGFAIFAFVGGNAKSLTVEQVKDSMFERQPILTVP
jgi:hypothetical protein